MIHKLLLAAGLLLGPALLHAADGNYPVGSIPAALKEKANAVVRMHQTTYTVKHVGEAITKIHRVVTLMNAQAKDQAHLIVYYNTAFDKVGQIEGTM